VSTAQSSTERTGTCILRVDQITAAYGPVNALRDISLQVNEGEIVAVLGPNGAGKSTLLGSIAGAHRLSKGSITFEGKVCSGVPAETMVRRGLSMVPEGRRIFASLTVEENLSLGGATQSRRAVADNMARTYEVFSILKDRRTQLAGTLSGGEQQQLAIGRALMSDPRLVLYDEPSLGLAPIIIERIFDLILTLREAGITTVLVEQNAHRAIQLADWVYVLASGHLESSGAAQDYRSEDLENLYLGGRTSGDKR
jgi:branched-chain amino acid transport system ATP-binding protein